VTAPTRKPARRRETLQRRMAIIARDGLRCGLAGCPVGGWGETRQAVARLRDELPDRSDRSYTVWDVIAVCYRLSHSGRYQWRGEAGGEA
jgi:hypothetical protein